MWNKFPRFYYITSVFIFLSLLLFNGNGDWFFRQKVGVATALALLLTAAVAKKLRLSVSLLFGYCLISAIWATMWPNNKFTHLGFDQFIVYSTTLRGTLTLLMAMCVAAFGMIPEKWTEDLFLSFSVIIIVHFFFLRKVFAPDGILMTPTLEATFLALIAPLALERCKWMGIVILGTICLMGGITGYGCLAALLWAKIFRMDRDIALSLAALIGTVVSAILYTGHIDWLYGPRSGQHRPEIWSAVWGWWKQNPAFHWLGTGAGTGYSMIPFIQSLSGKKQPLFMYLHNEYLQALLEIGYVGCALVLWTALDALALSIRDKKPRNLYFLCALAPACFSMFPIRHEVLMFFCIIQITRILRKPDQKSSAERRDGVMEHHLRTHTKPKYT